MKLRELIDHLGGMADGRSIQEILGDIAEEDDVKFVIKQRQYDPNSPGTHNHYDWTFYCFTKLSDALTFMGAEAEVNYEAGGWETLGLWAVSNGSKAVGEYKFIHTGWEDLTPEHPDGKWKE